MSDSMKKNMILSPSGKCHTFDAKADGYSRGEAINCIYVKPLRDALQKGDPIRAIIRSTAVNHDGKTPSFTFPNADAQESLIRRAYQRAGIDAIHETPVFECHGTGTAAGDFVETSVVAKVTQRKGAYIGAVKPNVGHSEGASGLTSLIKGILSLEHRTIPPNVNFETPNPKIPFIEAKLQVPLDPTPWPSNRPERISVNSFGIGGSNAHAVLESASTVLPDGRPPVSEHKDDPQLLVVSAHNQDSLQQRIKQITSYVAQNPARLHDVSYTLGMRREHLSPRAVAVVQPNGPPPESAAFSSFNSTTPSVTFVFTGQGAQWPGMGQKLIYRYPQFAEDIKHMDEALQALPDRPNWRLYDELYEKASNSRVNEAEFSQPLCSAIQIGLVNILRSWGVEASMVVGHSSGEIAAAYAARAISLKTAIILAYCRGKAAKSQEGSGGMVAVGLGLDEVKAHLSPGVVVACHNSPQSVTLSGDKEALDRAIESVKGANSDTLCRRLPVQIAYHSDHMKRIGSTYEDSISSYIEQGRDMLPLSSSVTGRIITDPRMLDAAYWRQNLEMPVLFLEAIQRIPSKEAPVFLEVGPHSALAGPLRQIFRTLEGKSPLYIPTLFRYDDDVQTQLLKAVGQAYGIGIPVDFRKVIEPGRTLTNLPRYPWQHDRPHWNESRLCREWRLRKVPHHEILGSRVLETTDHEPSWRNVLKLDNVPWLADHVLQGAITYPGAAYVAMAGEAGQQLHLDSDSYSVRNTKFVTPLLLNEEDWVEMVTSLRPIEVADGNPSGWYGFTISAHDGERWTIHCQGQVRAGSDYPPKPSTVSSYERAVSPQIWYQTLKRSGFEYGPQFQGLENITADPIGPRAMATVLGPRELHGSRYPLHPTAIDQCIQLLGLASSQGIPRHLTTLYVPAMIGSLFVGPGGPPMAVHAQSKSDARDGRLGNATAMLEDQVVLSMESAYLFPMENNETNRESGPGESISQIEWHSDIDLLPSPALLSTPQDYTPGSMKAKALGHLCLFFVLETADRIRDVEPGSSHLARWKNFILGTASSMKTGGQECLYRDSSKWALVDSATRQEMLREGVAKYNNEFDNDCPVLNTMELVFDNCKALLSGEANPLQILMKDDMLHRFYATHSSYADWGRLLQLLCHSNPGLHILEIGAGTGSATARVLEHLKSAGGAPLYHQYVFTDISSGFTTAASERFGHERMEYKALDITLDPVTQGFAANNFDLVIASNVLHATPNLQSTLGNVRRLLKSTGRLLLHELDTKILIPDYVTGVFPGWWLGENDGRADRPYISYQRWDRELRAAGFTGVDAVAHDSKPPYEISATLLSRPVNEVSVRTEVSLLIDEATTCQWASDLERLFCSKGYTTRRTTLEDAPPKGQLIVSMLDLEGSPIGSWPKDKYMTFQRYIEQVNDCQIVWVTPSTSHACADPRFGFIHGLARTLRTEMLLDISVFELPERETSGAKALIQVCEKIQKSRVISPPDLEYEFAFHDGEVKIGRYHWTSRVEQLARPPKPDAPRQLTLRTYGLLDTLHWAEKEPCDGLKASEVEVEMQYVGLNFRDMMAAMGFVESKQALGCEGSGVVRRVGSEVADLEAGDHVALTIPGLGASRVVVPRGVCLKLPEGLSLENGATMLTAYVTAFHSLLNVAALKKGQSVLIHSACGGVGLAAIQVCQAIGAEIYATVGNAEKVEYLVDHCSLPRERIYNSRNSSFKSDLMCATAGRGVDVVLNSLSGKLLHASWECVAKFGRMVELGKRDFLNHGMLDMSLFIGNRAFFGVDLSQASVELLSSALATTLDWYRRGKISPIRPVKIFDADDVVGAFRYMQAGTHIGKILVRFPSASNILPSPAMKELPSFRSDASYLLVGGFGGVGRSISTWMVEQNARELVFLSRSAGKSKDDQAFIRELEAQGCLVSCVTGSVTNLEDVNKAVGRCTKPLAGVFHLAVSLKDRLFLQMSHEEWEAVLAPKVNGSWSLHQATMHHSLDFFVVFGSISGVTGNTGQTNYAAATTFVEAFTRYRRQQGLPSSVLHLGVVGDVGAASRDAVFTEKAQAMALHVLYDAELIDGLAAAIKISPVSSASSTGALSIGVAHTKHRSDLPDASYIWGRDARFSTYHNLASESAAVGGDQSNHASVLRGLLARIEVDPSLLAKKETETALIRELGGFISLHLIGQAPEENQDGSDNIEALGGMALDSLIAIELRNWLRRSLGVEIAMVEINRAATLRGLVKVIIEVLREKHDESSA